MVNPLVLAKRGTVRRPLVLGDGMKGVSAQDCCALPWGLLFWIWCRRSARAFCGRCANLALTRRMATNKVAARFHDHIPKARPLRNLPAFILFRTRPECWPFCLGEAIGSVAIRLFQTSGRCHAVLPPLSPGRCSAPCLKKSNPFLIPRPPKQGLLKSRHRQILRPPQGKDFLPLADFPLQAEQ